MTSYKKVTPRMLFVKTHGILVNSNILFRITRSLETMFKNYFSEFLTRCLPLLFGRFPRT